MLVNCYSCQLRFTLTGWNPFRQTAICPVCGTHVRLAAAAKHAYGERVGNEVARILDALARVKTRGKDDHTYLADAAAARLKAIMAAAVRA